MYRFLFILAILFVVFRASASIQTTDSIMRLVIANVYTYEQILSKYEAKIYTKGHTEILKNNYLIRFAHNLLPVDRHNKNMLFEMVSNSKYTAPNIYQHEIEAINGNSIPNNKKQQEALNYLNLNIYSPEIYEGSFLSPLAPNALSYYHFTLLDTEESDGVKVYKIRFTPKQKSQKLVSGHLYIIDERWTIYKIDVSGRNNFTDFNIFMTFGKGDQEFNLPDKADLKISFKLLGNHIETMYHSKFDYSYIEWKEANKEGKRETLLDLTQYYSLSNREVPVIQDSLYWIEHRDIPLSEEEQWAYSEKTINLPDTAEITQYLKLTEDFTRSNNWYLNNTRIKYSGLINPFQLGYSGLNGVTYKQTFRFSKTFNNQHQLRFSPDVGYIFNRREVFTRIGSDWEYRPDKIGYLSFIVGNTYQGYSSKIIDDVLEQVNDPDFSLDNLTLPYFRTYYTEIRNNLELFNGFQLSAGISFYHRSPSKRQYIEEIKDANALINRSYNDFTPVISLSYTPRQYYRMDGKRKEYMYSYYPTFSAEIAQAIPNILNSSGDYCRIEANIQQRILLGLAKEFSYHIGGGLYTDQGLTYFADFRYFARNYFPRTWSEKIGGTFQLLNREWYNTSDKYLQVHLMYESPFILLQVLKMDLLKSVVSERLYFSQLSTPVLSNYTEVGYGVGNHIFNIALFAGFEKWDYQRVGVRFAFELFQ